MTSLPSSIGNLTNLKELILISNKHLHGLPDEIGILSGFETLNLEASYLKSLPSSIGNLANLKKLRLGRSESLRSL
jgi:Leucine-rich repeat (LRR) protein